MKMGLRLGLLVGLCASAVGAVDWNALKPQGYVSDFALLVDPASRVRLEAYCGALERSMGIQIAVVIIPSLAGEPVAEVAQTLYRAWTVGQGNQGGNQKSRAGGVLVLMAVPDRRVRLATHFGIDSFPFDRLLNVREERVKPREVQPLSLLASYLEGISRVIAAVDELEKYELEKYGLEKQVNPR